MAVIPKIAVQVFRESVRDKVLYNLVLFAVLLIAASYLIGQLTAGQEVKIIKDLGLGATQVFGLFIAVFLEGIPAGGVRALRNALDLLVADSHGLRDSDVLTPLVLGATQPAHAQDEQLAFPRREARLAEHVVPENEPALEQLGMSGKGPEARRTPGCSQGRGRCRRAGRERQVADRRRIGD